MSLGRIKLHLSGGKGIRYRNWPVTQGVPFADGEMRRGTPVRIVDEAGERIPVQPKCLATWNKDMEFVRWLLVDFQADLFPDEERTVFLEYGDSIEAALPVSPVRVDKADEYIMVDTGALRMKFRNTPQWLQAPGDRDVVESCMLMTASGWREMLGGHTGPFLYMKDQHGNVYDSVTAGFRTRATVEEAGPLRAVVRINGYHSTKEGQRFCPYILRMHMFAGRSDVYIHHTFVFDQEPHFIELSAIGVNFPLDLGDDMEASVGGNSTPYAVRDKWEELSLLQRSDRDYDIRVNGDSVAGGGKSAGWACLSGRSGSAVTVIRDHWQQYPKGIAVTEKGIDIRIWPEEYGETLKFTTPFEEPAIFFSGTRDEEEVKQLLAERPTAPLNLKSFNVNTAEDMLWVEAMVEKYAEGHAASYNDTGTSNGVGAARTTELLLSLAPDRLDAVSIEELAAAVQEPLLAVADPAYSCATGAFGHAYHAGDPMFAAVDAGLDDLVKMVIEEPVRKCRLYGMMRYGNMVCSHAPGPGFSYVYHKDTDPDKALRYVGPYNNEANDQISCVWGNYLRTGNRAHYFAAQRYSRNVADVAICHADPVSPENVGLMHYHCSHLWSGGHSPSHTLIAGLLQDYYLSGNQRLLDVCLEVADTIVAGQEACGILSCRGGVLHREFTGPLWNLLEIYQATWSIRYGETARRSLNWLLRTLPEPGNYPVSVYTRGESGADAVVEPASGCCGHAREVYQLWLAALRLFDSNKLREHILAEANHYVWDEPTDNYLTAGMAERMLTGRSLLWPVDNQFYWSQWVTIPAFLSSMVCLAYDLTGDPVYAAYARDQLDGTFMRQMDRIRHFADFRFTWLWFGGYVPRLMRIVADAEKKDPEGLKRAEEEWRGVRAANGVPVYDGPGVNLDIDAMDANGNIISRPPVDMPCNCPLRSYTPQVCLGELSTDDHL